MEIGLWNVLMKHRKNGVKNASILAAALQVQYRQSIERGDYFNIHTRINGWDDKAFYIEQWITLEKTNQIAFLLLVRLVPTPRSLTPQLLIDQLYLGNIQLPQLSKNMQVFKDNHRLEFQHINSKI